MIIINIQQYENCNLQNIEVMQFELSHLKLFSSNYILVYIKIPKEYTLE